MVVLFLRKFIDYLGDDSSVLEKEPLKSYLRINNYMHLNIMVFAQSNNIRDKMFLDELINEKKAP